MTLTGAIPRIERQETHHNFLWAVRPPLAMVGLTHAARIAMHNTDFFPPETNVILTSTIGDSDLSRYTLEDELRIIHALEPEYIIPFDFPVYADMDPSTRRQHLQQISQGTEDLHTLIGQLTDRETDHICTETDLPQSLVEQTADSTIIPLIKGTTPDERAILHRTAQRLSAPAIAKYGVQYMTVGGNGSYPQLIDDLETTAVETNNYPTLIIGLLSPDGRYSLEGTPDNVIAGAGTNQWIKRTTPANSTPEEMQSAFQTLYNTAAKTLGQPDRYDITHAETTANTPPTELTKSPGNSVGNDLSPSTAGAADEGGYGFGERKRPTDAMDAITAGRLGGQHTPDN